MRNFYGIGNHLAPRLIAEIGYVRRFYKEGALVAYAGLDAPPYQSGSIRGSPLLRKTLFEAMRVLLINCHLRLYAKEAFRGEAIQGIRYGWSQ